MDPQWYDLIEQVSKLSCYLGRKEMNLRMHIGDDSMLFEIAATSQAIDKLVRKQKWHGQSNDFVALHDRAFRPIKIWIVDIFEAQPHEVSCVVACRPSGKILDAYSSSSCGFRR